MYATALYLILTLTLALAGPALAATDPSLAEVYEAAKTGDLERAQEMMNAVLRDHPRSAKAHFVRAQLYAKQGNLARGRQELNTAQSLEPSLPFATPDSVRELQTELSRTQSVSVRPARLQTGASHGWWMLAVAVVAGVILWFVFPRRRSAGNVYSQPATSPGTAAGAGVSPSVGAGMGTGIAGGLASGLAAGAGIVAGEEIARHLLGSDRREDNTPLTSEPATGVQSDPVEPDFGVSNASSWDDDGPAPDDGSGNDDWS